MAEKSGAKEKKQGKKANSVVRAGKGSATAQTFTLNPKVLGEIREMIESTRQRVAAVVNAGLVQLYWSIGERIRREILGNKRAEYGEEIVYALSRQLTDEYGQGFSQANLFHMIRFAEVYPDRQILSTLSAQLSWTHLRDIIYLENDLKRDFYAEMCRIERWSTRTLRKKIDGMLYERTAISRKPDETIRLELRRLKEEDRTAGGTIHAFIFGNVKEKVLPLPGSDVTDIWPPWRSTMRLQTASPMPVPLYFSAE